jgi:hypothetical protein
MRFAVPGISVSGRLGRENITRQVRRDSRPLEFLREARAEINRRRNRCGFFDFTLFIAAIA